ncbi:oxidoreductase [Pseudorhodoferax sp.]|uniref:oxidoreductase n=1 Tax=Pseudorhodoferax sp. TaxID=1993553 RepID=UPI002DD65A86|nr:oxidoreductase [Pseudorhodoferax sp.]
MTATTNFPRVWLITGASRGFGLRIARAALARGDAVVATARNVATLAALGDAPGLLPLALDVTDEAQAQTVAQAAIARFGRIDVLVNNAGFGLLGAVEEASGDEVRRLYETNVFGLLNVTRAVLPGMRARRAGHVLNFSSVGGLRSGPGFGVYCSTKFAVEGLSEALHAELAPLNVHVTVIEPGYFRTEFLESNSLVVSPRELEDYAATAGQVRAAARRISLNQPGDPDKLVTAVLQLADASTPPRRLPLGTDTLAVLDARGAELQEETQAWRAVSASTDFAAPAA